jgi:adenine deaminase
MNTRKFPLPTSICATATRQAITAIYGGGRSCPAHPWYTRGEGAIAPGYDADLAVLDDALPVRARVVAGVWLTSGGRS